MSEVITLITNGIYISSVSPEWLTTVNPATWWYALSVLKQRWYTPRTSHSDLFKRYFILHPYCSKHFVALRMIWCHQNKSSLQYSLIIPKALKLIKWKKKNDKLYLGKLCKLLEEKTMIYIMKTCIHKAAWNSQI